MTDAQHPEPVEVDLGLQHTFEVEPILAGLEEEGIWTYLVDQAEVPGAIGLGPKQCRVLVRPDDEARVREVFAAEGFL
ncbi:MAG: hypothetical protein U0P45_13460 [Acidimicrobiales bacterium]